MAVLKKKYVDINDTLRHIRLQVKEGKNWADDNIPYFISPTELYHWLRIRTTYKNDPDGIELLQSAPTLFDNNFHGIPGAGDCDCFTIATLTALNKQKFNGRPWIKLAGRTTSYPVHIWGGIDHKGEEIALDLTNRRPFEERKYKHIQKIYFNPL
jgi:hypothetical protein